MNKPEILSDEEILSASLVDMFLPNGDLDPDCGYLQGRIQVAQAQRDDTYRKTLEQVIVMIELGDFDHASMKGHKPIGSYADDCLACRNIQALKSQLEEVDSESK